MWSRVSPQWGKPSDNNISWYLKPIKIIWIIIRKNKKARKKNVFLKRSLLSNMSTVPWGEGRDTLMDAKSWCSVFKKYIFMLSQLNTICSCRYYPLWLSWSIMHTTSSSPSSCYWAPSCLPGYWIFTPPAYYHTIGEGLWPCTECCQVSQTDMAKVHTLGTSWLILVQGSFVPSLLSFLFSQALDKR